MCSKSSSNQNIEIRSYDIRPQSNKISNLQQIISKNVGHPKLKAKMAGSPLSFLLEAESESQTSPPATKTRNLSQSTN